MLTPADLVHHYLAGRGITIPVPPTIRASTVVHLGRVQIPIMVAAVQRLDGKVVAVQTTLLTWTGKKASVSVPRITTGALGAGAVRLGPAGPVLGLAEGVETGLSALQIARVPVWCCLGAGRMHRVAIPSVVRELHIFGDEDEPGRAAAERTADAHIAAGRRVVLRFPPAGCKDWNDALRASAEVAA
jgi:putative DNA primase/helicase